MSEQSARITFRTNLKKQLPSVHVQRFEDKYHAGIPDLNLCYEGCEIWVEAKYIPSLPATADQIIKVGLRIEQTLWLNNRKRVKGNCLVLVRVGYDHWFAFNNQFKLLQNGVSVSDFYRHACYRNAKLLCRALLASAFTTPPPSLLEPSEPLSVSL